MPKKEVIEDSTDDSNDETESLELNNKYEEIQPEKDMSTQERLKKPRKKSVYVKTEKREKQISDMLAKRKENIEKRKLAKQAEDDLINEKLKEKLLKKAETIKKQQSKKEKVIDSIPESNEKIAPTIEYKEKIVYLPAPQKKIVPMWC
jgi:hypothetical protein